MLSFDVLLYCFTLASNIRKKNQETLIDFVEIANQNGSVKFRVDPSLNEFTRIGIIH